MATHGAGLSSVMSKVKKKAGIHQSLTQQILGRDAPKATTRNKAKKTDKREENEEVVGERMSVKILKEARLQQEELEEEYGIGVPSIKQKSATDRTKAIDSSDEEEDDDELVFDECDIKVDEEDEKAMRRFMRLEDAQQQKTLTDLIMEKIRDKETEISTRYSDHASTIVTSQFDERVVQVYKSVALILSKYRAGKLPKAFKVIPSLTNWEEILYLTEPDKWSAASMLHATRIFSSNLSAVKAQRFYNLVLLPRIRDDITEYKRLNFHLYMALKKALFKPAAFFKGILIPICQSGTCTLREALIISSVITKISIPLLHSCAALLKIAEMEYSGANSIFIRTLLDKKYALPYRVIDAVVFHFLRFRQDPRDMPVLWHQSLLTFVQRYKEDISFEQKEALLELLRLKPHIEITGEVRREIVHSKCRDVGSLYNDICKKQMVVE